MNKILQQLETIKNEVQEKIEDREISFDERSEDWQDSGVGQMYNDKTEELQDVIDNIEMTIDSINTYLD